MMLSSIMDMFPIRIVVRNRKANCGVKRCRMR